MHDTFVAKEAVHDCEKGFAVFPKTAPLVAMSGNADQPYSKMMFLVFAILLYVTPILTKELRMNKYYCIMKFPFCCESLALNILLILFKSKIFTHNKNIGINEMYYCNEAFI